MRHPHSLSGRELVKLLARLGYGVDYRTVEHLRLTTSLAGSHSITFPSGDFLSVTTRSRILKAVAEHLRLSREELLQILVGR